jgi:imidazole glycerol-phosphate synthase subunit HisH
MISIINYGVSNVGSMLNMLRKIGTRAEVVSTPEEVARAQKIVLPGVGAFDNGMDALRRMGLVETLVGRVMGDRVPLLGVCLGMQLLSAGSEEGEVKGLGLIPGFCRRFQSQNSTPIKIPHMGWNEIAIRRDDPLMKNLEEARFYFVHAYYVVCDDPADEVASSHHGVDFTAAFHRENIWGVQFHPEKSHRFGMTLLKNFVEL